MIALRLSASSRLTAALYYLVDPSFRREQRAVISSLIAHHKQSNQTQVLYRLRRNVHRIEKGLIMRPRKPVFALDYIEETVNAYISLRVNASSSQSVDLLSWASDVLTEYFAAVETNAFVEGVRLRFRTHRAPPSSSSRIPYSQGSLAAAGRSVSYEQLLELTRSRRSVRWFLERPVERSKIEAALAVAAQAPSSCNRQPFQYRVFDDPALANTLFSLPLGTAGFGRSAPVVIAVTGDLSAYFDERDRHGIYIDASLSIMAFLTALQTLGLGSCTVNWPDIEHRERKMEQFLGLLPYERVIMLLLVGYPDPTRFVAYSEKTAVQDLVLYNVIGATKQ